MLKQSNSNIWEFKYYGKDPRIDDLNPARNPVLIILPRKPLKTRIFTCPKIAKEWPGETKQVIYDGISRSPFFHLSSVVLLRRGKTAPKPVSQDWLDDEFWVVDMQHAKLFDCCDSIELVVREVLQLRGNTSWPILGVDYGDDPKLTHCPKIPSIIGAGKYRLVKRSVAKGRLWNMTAKFPLPGVPIEAARVGAGPVLHGPYPVRSDLAAAIANEVKKRGLVLPFDNKRNLDVAHPYARTTHIKDNLRMAVNEELSLLANLTLPGRQPIRTFAGLAGANNAQGRQAVSPRYVELLLNARVIIVAQRDEWVGHYRLFEALISGAMTLADDTIDLPRGIRHGESLVLFESLTDLREKILYYTDLKHEEERKRIARKGWEIAMGYHRSWHTMEATIFGNPISRVGDPLAIYQYDLSSHPAG